MAQKQKSSIDELVALISRYSDCRDVTGRVMLTWHVDYALGIIKGSDDLVPLLGLVSLIAEIGRKGMVSVPGWIDKALEEAVGAAVKASAYDNESELVVPLLTLHLINGDGDLEREAERIINRCYESMADHSSGIDMQIDNLHTAVMCCDYVCRFSAGKSAAVWNRLADCALASGINLTSRQLFRLLETAKELEGFAPVAMDSRNALRRLLKEKTRFDSSLHLI